MIDIHAHVLPQIDDGPNSWEETMAMLHQGEEDGITEVAITHHILSNLDFAREGEIITKYKELKKRIELERIKIKVHLGSELYSQADMELDHTIATYNDNKKYFLVEFPMQGIPKFVADYFFDIITQKNLIPVIAHPERNLGFVRNPDRAYEFVQRGALLQMNAGSIVGRHGEPVKDTATILLNSNLIHFVGSDAHNTKRRPMKLRGAMDIITENWGEERARALFYDNPRKIINGDPFTPPEPLPVEPLKKSFMSKVKSFFK